MTWFIGGKIGSWRAVRVDPVVGVPLARISRLEVTEREAQPPIGDWVLRGVMSFERYVTRAERSLLEARQGSLGRPSATRAALIPVRKSAAWWDLPQDERRAILEERSHHIRNGLEHLPDVARRLYHSRAPGEPLDLPTWFAYGPDHAAAFVGVRGRPRGSARRGYVERQRR